MATLFGFCWLSGLEVRDREGNVHGCVEMVRPYWAGVTFSCRLWWWTGAKGDYFAVC